MMRVYVNKLTHEQAVSVSKIYLENIFHGISFDFKISEEDNNHLIISWRAGPLVNEVNEVSIRLYNHINDQYSVNYLFNIFCNNGKIIKAFMSEYDVEFFTVSYKIWAKWIINRLLESFRISNGLPAPQSIIQMPFTRIIMKRDSRFRRP